MGYETIQLDISDAKQREELLKLWTDNMSDKRIAEVASARAQWLYAENPSGPPHTVLATYGDPVEVVGCGSTLVCNFWAMTEMASAGVQCDFAVTKRHRLGAAATAIQNALIANGRMGSVGFMLAFPNEKSLPIFKRVGYRVVTQAHGWVKPLRSLAKLRARLKTPFAARGASLIVDAVLRAIDSAYALPIRGRYRGEILDQADERFDALWERARDKDMISVDKTAAFLNWRYAEFKSRRHQFFALSDKHGTELSGFLVFAVEDGKVFVHNLFAADLTTTLDALLLTFAAAMRNAGYLSIFISYAGRHAFGKRLHRLLFRRSDHRERNLVLFVNAPSGSARAARLVDPDNWLIFEGEMDI